MGLFDWLSGVKQPGKGVDPQPAAEVHAALISLNNEDAPFLIRDGRPEEVDLVAEWKIALPQWYGFFGSVSRINRTLMRFDTANNELRSVDQEFRVTWTNGVPEIALAKEFNRGQINKVESKASLVRNEEGKIVLQREKSFSSKDLKAPIQSAVTGLGWSWRGVSFGKL